METIGRKANLNEIIEEKTFDVSVKIEELQNLAKLIKEKVLSNMTETEKPELNLNKIKEENEYLLTLSSVIINQAEKILLDLSRLN